MENSDNATNQAQITEQKPDDKKQHDHDTYRHEKKHVLCMIGIEKHYIEKDLIKFLRKYLESEGKDLPVQSVHKKRGQTFGFLNFQSEE